MLGGLLLAVPRRNVPLMPLVLTLAAAGGAWLSLVVGGWIARAARRSREAAGARAESDAPSPPAILRPAMELSALRVAGLIAGAAVIALRASGAAARCATSTC